MSSDDHHGESIITRIAMWSAHHRRTVALGWVVIVIIALAGCSAIKADTEIKPEAPGESGKAFNLFKERFGVEQGNAQEIVVFSHPSLAVNSPEYHDTVQGLMGRLRELRSEQTQAIGATDVTSSKRVVSPST